MALMVLLLMAIFGGIGWLQAQSLALLNSTVVYQGDNIVWSFFQLEAESLRLGQALQVAVARKEPIALDSLSERYEIYVSRISLVEPERTREVMPELEQHRWVIARLHTLVARMDRILGLNAPRLVDPAEIQALLPEFEEAAQSIRDLSLLANHAVAEGVTRRNEAVRDQNRIGIGLTMFQCLLIGAFAYVVVRQVRALEQRRSELEQLARHLQSARTEAEQASRAKSAFLANMSHELRTPFNGLLGMMSLLDRSALTLQQRDFLGVARQSGEHLLTILNDVLDFSKMESGRMDLVARPTDLRQAIGEVEALMAPQARGKGLQFEVDLAADLPLVVQADAKRVKQVLFNLLGNAIKFTDAGRVRMQVDRCYTAQGRAATRFCITDTGIGMGEETQASLFQRFSQGDDSIGRRFGGTGLGLEISRTLATLMEGEISVVSEVGCGSEFTVVLPLPELDAAALVPHPGSLPDGVAQVSLVVGATTGCLRVLVADDHPVNRKFMQVLLERLGHQVLLATQGAEAVAVVRAQGCDLVLMDLHMPVMDGLAATRAIRALPAPQSCVRIVALTADAFSESRERVREAGMDEFLAKPVQLHDIEELLRRHFGARAVGSMVPVVLAAVPPTAAPAVASGVAGGAVAGPVKPERRRRPRIKPGEAARMLDLALIADTCAALSVQSYGALLAGFLADESASLADLLASLEPGGAAADRAKAAHRLKGAAASLGLCALADTAREIETGADALTQDTASLAAQCLRTQFEAARDITCRLGWSSAA
jgi:signal transduction histidine kinase/ActR/RegA family two-component response regulator/HPt (histidine-containing phosphotransfer) domain-containing protein